MNFNFPGWNHLNNASVFSNESLYNKKRTVGNFANLVSSMEKHALSKRKYT